ncbi:MAG TPA: hypothetical protein VN620_18210, partial [Candidatus Methylomirabilis sp.]|nr:hypothetical protein [Candidatus Methylomirabilis sp.]
YHAGSATLGQAMHPRIIEYITRNQLFVLMKDYPKAVFRTLLPRILLYQAMWCGLAVTRTGLAPYLRGIRGALRARKRMKQKHRELMMNRTVDDEFLLSLIRTSERQVFDWQQSVPANRRSSLLTFYFRVFPPE